MKKEIIRKTWPRVSTVKVKGVWLYKIDARRSGTNGKREFRTVRKEAEERAAEIAAEFESNGKEGLALPAHLRTWALLGEQMLAPYGKTIMQACEHYRDFLEAEKVKADSAFVAALAKKWYEEKSHPSQKLKKPTVKGIRQTSNLLQKAFPTLRIKELDKPTAKAFIFSLQGDYQQENTRSRCSQFMNWCITNEYADSNPFDAKILSVAIEEKDITIFTAAEAEKIMRLCEKKHRDIIVFMAVCLFAGLRPGEAELLTWENIHLEEKTIHVLGSTSKSKLTHNVDIEDNLLAWLNEYRPDKLKGPICPRGKTLERRRAALHAELGFKAAGLNPKADEIEQDITRHSYASHWQAKNQNVDKLADMMANSPEVIREYYRKVVSKKEYAAYNAILPADEEEEDDKPTTGGMPHEDEDAAILRMERDRLRYKDKVDPEGIEDEDVDEVEEDEAISAKALEAAARQILRASKKSR